MKYKTDLQISHDSNNKINSLTKENKRLELELTKLKRHHDKAQDATRAKARIDLAKAMLTVRAGLINIRQVDIAAACGITLPMLRKLNNELKGV